MIRKYREKDEFKSKIKFKDKEKYKIIAKESQNTIKKKKLKDRFKDKD